MIYCTFLQQCAVVQNNQHIIASYRFAFGCLELDVVNRPASIGTIHMTYMTYNIHTLQENTRDSKPPPSRVNVDLEKQAKRKGCLQETDFSNVPISTTALVVARDSIACDDKQLDVCVER